MDEVKITLEENKIDENIKLFDSLVVNTGHKVSDLSKQHRVILLAIKWFGCPLCQEVMEKVAEMLHVMLQKNTIPVICYQQKEDSCKSFIKDSKNKVLKEFLYCQLNKEQRKGLGLHDASLLAHMKAMPKNLNLMVNEKKYFTLPTDVIAPFSCFGVYSVEESKITKQVIYNDFTKRLNFGFFLEDMGFSRTQGTEMDYVSSILKLYSNLEIKTIKKVSQEVNIQLNNRIDSDGKALREILEDDQKRYFFKVFSTNEFATENLLFYEEVVQFKKIKEDEKDKKTLTAMRIYKYYLEEGSISQVNTSLKITQPIKDTLDGLKKDSDVPNDIFDQAVESAFINMCDTYSRFSKSSFYKDMNSKNKKISYFI